MIKRAKKFTEQVSFRLSPELAGQLDPLCAGMHRDRAFVARAALELLLEHGIEKAAESLLSFDGRRLVNVLRSGAKKPPKPD